MLPEAKRYAHIVLESNPKVMRRIVGNIASDSPFWDFKPYPERFTMRSVLAHLADWDLIFMGRIEKILALDTPELPAFDEGQMAIDNNYAHQNPHDNFSRWSANRTQLTARFVGVPDEFLGRQGMRTGQGLISIADYMAMVTLHDSYHIGQALDYIQQWDTLALK